MKYAQNLIPILLHHLAAVGTTELTFDRWFVTLGMISDGFYDEDKIDEVCFFMRLKTQDIQNAVVKLTKLCKDCLMNVLRRLEKERIVSVVENEYIVKGSVRTSSIVCDDLTALPLCGKLATNTMPMRCSAMKKLGLIVLVVIMCIL